MSQNKPKQASKSEQEVKEINFYTLVQKNGGFVVVKMVARSDGIVTSFIEEQPDIYAIAISQLNKKIRADLDI